MYEYYRETFINMIEPRLWNFDIYKFFGQMTINAYDMTSCFWGISPPLPPLLSPPRPPPKRRCFWYCLGRQQKSGLEIGKWLPLPLSTAFDVLQKPGDPNPAPLIKWLMHAALDFVFLNYFKKFLVYIWRAAYICHYPSYKRGKILWPVFESMRELMPTYKCEVSKVLSTPKSDSQSH